MEKLESNETLPKWRIMSDGLRAGSNYFITRIQDRVTDYKQSINQQKWGPFNPQSYLSNWLKIDGQIIWFGCTKTAEYGLGLERNKNRLNENNDLIISLLNFLKICNEWYFLKSFLFRQSIWLFLLTSLKGKNCYGSFENVETLSKKILPK